MSNDKYHDHEIRINRLEDAVININKLLDNFDKRLDRLEKRLESMDARIDSNFRWTIGIIISNLLVMMGGFAGILGVLAHGFGWI